MLIDLPVAVLIYTGVRVRETLRRGPAARRLRRRAIAMQDESGTLPVPRPQRKPLLSINQAGVATIATGALRALVPSPPIILINIGLYLYCMLPFFRQVEVAAVQVVTERKVHGFLLMGIGNLLLLGTGRFLTADISVVLGNVLHGLQAKAKGTAERNLSRHLFEHLLDPEQAVWIERDGVELECRLGSVHSGDLLVVRSGETIAADGVVVGGMASVDQHAFTGESYPVEKGEGESVFASTLVLTGRLKVRVERSGRDTAIARIGAILEQSMAAKTDVQLRAEQWADRANLPFLGIAGLGLLVSGPVGAVVILGGNTVQAMQMLAPLAMLNFQSLAAHRGILLKNGAALERLGAVDTVLFDKTGTLTDGTLRVHRVHVLAAAGDDALAEPDVLAQAAVAERQLSHPIARAIVAAAEAAGIRFEPEGEHAVRLGFGVMVEHAGRAIRVGSARFMQAEGIGVPGEASMLERAIHDRGHSLVLVALDTVVVGVIELAATLRADLPAVIDGLRQRGIRHIAIVSGDHIEPTRRLAAQLGVDDYHAEVLPEQKAEIVRRARAEGGNVCFVGDGVNDAIAMQQADLSISLSGATTLAVDVADIVLMDPDLKRLCALSDLSRRLDGNLKRGLAICYTGMGIVVAGSFLLRIDVLLAMGVHAVLGTGALGNAMLPLVEGRLRGLSGKRSMPATRCRARPGGPGSK